MKKISYLSTLGCLLFAACQQSTGGYKINGNISGVADGELVYLQKLVNNELQIQDSATVTNGHFEFTGKQDSTINCYLAYKSEGRPQYFDFFLENGNIEIKLDTASTVSGTQNNEIYQSFKDKYKALNNELGALYRKIKSGKLKEEEKAALTAELNKKDSLGMEFIYKLLSDNMNNAVGVHLLPGFSSAFDLPKVKALLDKVPAQYANSESIVSLKEYIETAQKTEVGQKFVDFTMDSPEGTPVKLADEIAKNKLTLIDFWASWCGPCRAEMPNVVETYNAYKAKGFGIVGVSLDEKKDAWTGAIKNMNMTWTHMSDLKGWQNAGAQLYGVRSIPSTVLVDQNGVIIARNLRGEELKAKIGELLK